MMFGWIVGQITVSVMVLAAAFGISFDGGSYPFWFFHKTYDDGYAFQKLGIIFFQFFGWPIYIPFYVLCLFYLAGRALHSMYIADRNKWREKNFDKWIKNFEKPVKWIKLDGGVKLTNVTITKWDNYHASRCFIMEDYELKEMLSTKSDALLAMEPMRRQIECGRGYLCTKIISYKK